MTARIRKVCSRCGSVNVLCDAWAEWDETEQAWTLQNTFDNSFCEDCDGETSIDDQEIVLAAPWKVGDVVPYLNSRASVVWVEGVNAIAQDGPDFLSWTVTEITDGVPSWQDAAEARDLEFTHFPNIEEARAVFDMPEEGWS